MTADKKTLHRTDIDGLRAVAIALVVGFHSGVPLFTGGFIGVDVFFVISGYLIGGIVYREMLMERFSYLNFYARRIRRIAPALIVMLISCSAISFMLMSPGELKYFSIYSLASLLSVPNIALWLKADYFAPSSELNPLLMTWSLGIEEQFYLFLPPMILLFHKNNKTLIFALVAIIAISFFLSVSQSGNYPIASFYLLHTRAWELASGVLFYIISKQPKIFAKSIFTEKAKDLQFLLGFTLLTLATVLFDKSVTFPGWYAIIPVLATIMMISGNGRISKFLLCNKFFVFIGLISYSWYLWHWPLLSFARMSSISDLHWVAGVAISIAALIPAYLSYKYVETPFRIVSGKVQERHWIIGYVCVVLTCALPMLWAYQKQGFPSRVPSTLWASEKKNPCLVGYGETHFNETLECLPAESNRPSIALLGDSHASMLKDGLNKAADHKGLNVLQLTKSSCPFLIGVSREIRSRPMHFSECSQYNQSVLDYIKSRPDIEIILLAGFWEAGIDAEQGEGYRYTQDDISLPKNVMDVFENSLVDTVNLLTKMGKKVIVIEDTPTLSFDPRINASIQLIPFRSHLNKIVGGEGVEFNSNKTNRIIPFKYDLTKTLKNIMREDSSVSMFSIPDQLCRDELCAYKDNESLYYIDNQHLSSSGSLLVMDGINLPNYAKSTKGELRISTSN